MSKFLDTEGLKKLWNKVKTYVSDAVAKVEVKEVPWSIITGKPELATKDDITNVYRWKGSVDNYDALPNEGQNKVGDVYDTLDTGMNYGWTGDKWDPLGTEFKIEAISDSEIDEITSAE